MLISRRRRLLDFARVFDRVASFLDERGFPCAVVGALALHAYGHSRATFDLDIVTTAAVREPLVRFLEDLGYETQHVSPGYSNHAHAEREWGVVDIIYVDEPTAQQLFERSTRRLQLGDREACVPSPEHLAAMKVQAMRNDPTRRIQDLADVQHLLRLPDVDRGEIRGYFDGAGLLDWYEKLVATL